MGCESECGGFGTVSFFEGNLGIVEEIVVFLVDNGRESIGDFPSSEHTALK